MLGNRKIDLTFTALLCASVALVSSGCGVVGGESTTITAEFPDTAGLFVGNDVGVRGVKIGTVDKIEPKGRAVLVTLSVDGDTPIPANANANIVSRSVATDRYVELAPQYSGGDRMTDGANIPMERTETPVDFDQVLTALNRFSVGIAGSKSTKQAVRRFLRISAKTLGPNGEEMNQAITGLSESVNAITGQKDNIVGTMNSLDGLASRLVANEQTLREFYSTVAGATQFLAAERNNFEQALRTLSDTVDIVARFAKENRARLKATVDDAADVADILLSRRPQVEEFIELMPLALQNIARTRVPNGVRIRGDLVSGLPTTVLSVICGQLPPALCQLANGVPTGPLTDLLGNTGL